MHACLDRLRMTAPIAFTTLSTLGPHRYYRLDHSRPDMKCPSTLCAAFQFFEMRETKADVNYDIFWAVFDKNRVTLRKLADKLKYKKDIEFQEIFNKTTGTYDKRKVVTKLDRNKKHIIRFAIPWIPGFDAMLGKKDSLARTQSFCLKEVKKDTLMDPDECYFSTPSFVVNENPEEWIKVRSIQIGILYVAILGNRNS